MEKTYNLQEYKKIITALELEEEKVRIIAELTNSALWEYDIETKELRQFKKLSGRYAKSTLNVPDYRITMLRWNLIYPDDIPVFHKYCDSMDLGEEYILYDIRFLSDSDEFLWIRFQGIPLKNTEGQALCIIGKTSIVEDEKKEQISISEERDPLTNLFNEPTTRDKVEKCLKRCNDGKYEEQHCFMIIDIDGFKHINERFGYLYGDIVIEAFAKHLLGLFDDTDIIGRMYGDVFIVYYKEIKSLADIHKKADSIRHMIRGNLPELKKENDITISIGASVYPTDGSTYDELFKKADMALFKVKEQGKDNYLLFNPTHADAYNSGETERKKIKKDRNRKTNRGIVDAEKRLLDFTFDVMSKNVDAKTAMNIIFTEIGKYYDLSRITVFEKAIPNQNAKISYEWLNAGISSCKSIFAGNLDALIKANETLLSDKGYFYCEEVMYLEVGPYIKKLFKKAGIRTILQCPITDKDQYIGIVNFENSNNSRSLQQFEIDTLRIITKIISNFILQIRSKEELKNEIFFTQAMLNNQKLSNYAIKPDTYELLYMNKYIETAYPNIKLGELCYKAIHGRTEPCKTCPLLGLKDNKSRYSVESYNEKSDAWFSKTASEVELQNGQRMYFICSSDVTSFLERVKARDSLTGLLTLSKFTAEAMKLLASAKNINYAIIYSDFDKFKYINDEWGYSVGDEIIKYYAARVSRLLSSSELFCRVAGDTFTILLSYREKEDALERIERLMNTITNDFSAKFPKVNPIIISGIYFLTQEDKILSLALDKANIARKTLKGYHKSNYAIYDEKLFSEIRRQKLIEDRMYSALENHEFVVYMQPKVDLRTLSVIGAEALVRWKIPEGTMLSPMEFIPLFEKNGFIIELDFYVYEKAVQTLRSWLDSGKMPIIVSLNVSRLHIDDPFFVEKLDQLVLKYNIPRNLIEIEITETLFLKSMDGLIKMMDNLHTLGYLISIDDFGSGYSSLNLLKTLPIDIIKLDKEFFMQNKMEDKDKIVINSIIQLAKGLGLKVISEGVETLEQAKFLRECRCDMVQGYFFYQPLPIDNFAEIIE